MTLSYKTRKRLSLLILLVGLPLYIAAAVFVVSLFERPSIFVELLIYIGLGCPLGVAVSRRFPWRRKGQIRTARAEPNRPHPGRRGRRLLGVCLRDQLL